MVTFLFVGKKLIYYAEKAAGTKYRTFVSQFFIWRELR